MTTLRLDEKLYRKRQHGPSRLGWALLLLAIVTAGIYRFWQLGELPPGLYRDEAFNGMDALDVLDGQLALFFPANNGREPVYIYLTALAISFLGRSALAVRLGAALVGTLTTWLIARLAGCWFGWRIGLLSAWIWAVTLWPVHLGRIGLRPILIAPALVAAFWLGTTAFRRGRRELWVLSGLVYGAGFYTYLAFRFSPLLLIFVALYLWRTERWRALRSGLPWFGLGTAITLAPLVYLFLLEPDLVLGRAGQVSIFNPTIHGGNFWATLARQVGRSLGLFIWRGDTILRHNPGGRPVFDLFMALPFLAGVIWCVRHWQRPAATVLLAWVGIMLGPTILAEDAPHFLRAAGILPAAMILPALGLDRLWGWPRLPASLRQGLVVALIGASALLTVRDYVAYGRSQDVAYMFEAAAADMASQIRSERPDTAVLVDEMYWAGWPSIPFLAGGRPVTFFHYNDNLPGPQSPPAAIYAWPYEALDFIPRSLPPPALISAEDGGLARGDLEKVASPLYVRFSSEPKPETSRAQANFGDVLQLQQAQLVVLDESTVAVELDWTANSDIEQELIVFVHVLDERETLLAQDDAPPAAGRWPRQWWQPDLVVRDRHVIELSEPYDAGRQQIQIGVYDAFTRVRLPLLDSSGTIVSDTWLLKD